MDKTAKQETVTTLSKSKVGRLKLGAAMQSSINCDLDRTSMARRHLKVMPVKQVSNELEISAKAKLADSSLDSFNKAMEEMGESIRKQETDTFLRMLTERGIEFDSNKKFYGTMNILRDVQIVPASDDLEFIAWETIELIIGG